jgi:hypothetical protein
MKSAIRKSTWFKARNCYQRSSGIQMDSMLLMSCHVMSSHAMSCHVERRYIHERLLYTNIQIYKYTNIQIYKYTNIQTSEISEIFKSRSLFGAKRDKKSLAICTDNARPYAAKYQEHSAMTIPCKLHHIYDIHSICSTRSICSTCLIHWIRRIWLPLTFRLVFVWASQKPSQRTAIKVCEWAFYDSEKL